MIITDKYNKIDEKIFLNNSVKFFSEHNENEECKNEFMEKLHFLLNYLKDNEKKFMLVGTPSFLIDNNSKYGFPMVARAQLISDFTKDGLDKIFNENIVYYIYCLVYSNERYIVRYSRNKFK